MAPASAVTTASGSLGFFLFKQQDMQYLQDITLGFLYFVFKRLPRAVLGRG
jgi:hypothetical protein